MPLHDINIIKKIMGEVKNRHKRAQKKYEPYYVIRTHDPPCSRSDALTSELLRTDVDE